MNTQTQLSQIFQPVEPALSKARRIINQLWREALSLTYAQDKAEQSGEGKLLRPALCLLAAGALNEQDLERYAPLAAAYEVVHMASLAHDDVVDHALLRRGRDSLNVQLNNHTAILCGDYLVARGIELINSYASTSLIASALQAVREMAEGELRFFGRDPGSAPEDDCIALARSKTASLFAAACCGPALLIAPNQHERLYEFGIHLGIAFQLIDDLLDLTQPTSALGKPACGDVVEGKHTLPIFLLRRAMTPTEQERLAALRGGPASDEDCRWIRGAVRASGVDTIVSDRARQYIARGVSLLEELPASRHREAMCALAEFVMARRA